MTPDDEPEITLTRLGEAGYRVLRWVQEDIPGRVAQGQEQLAPLIAEAAGDDDATAELSGVAAYLMRYADARYPPAASRSG